MVIGSKYKKYLEILKEQGVTELPPSVISVDTDPSTTSPAMRAFEELKLKRYCCRRHLLSHIDLVDKI
jgi:DNA-directed RNA polymerase subunit N (RpoN/RPB10)